MKFKEALKDVPVGGKVGEILERTSRMYPCDVCREVTGWRKLDPECPGVPICSDECLDISNEREKEFALQVETTSVSEHGGENR